MTRSFYDFCVKSDRLKLLSQWDTKKNGSVTPHNVSKTSRTVVWWKCEEGHEWCTQAVSRTKGTGCPECYRLKQEQMRKNKKDFGGKTI